MSLRPPNRKDDPPPEYDKEGQLITLKFHHGGSLETEPIPYYEGGEVSVFDEVHIGGLSVMDLHNLCERAGVYGRTRLYTISEENDAHKLRSDRELNVLCKKAVASDRVLVLYVVDFYLDEALAEDAGEDSDEKESGSDKADDDNSSYGEWSGVDSEYDEDNDDLDYDDNVDEGVEWVGKSQDGNINSSRVKATVEQQPKCRNIRKGEDTVESSDENTDDEIEESDEDFDSLHESDEESGRKAPVFNPDKDMYNPPLQCGLIFSNFEECKAAIKNWNIKRGRRYKFVKNDKCRVKAICADEDCNWEVYASRLTGKESRAGSVHITTLMKKHTCNFLYNNPCVKSSWVAKKYTEVLRENPKVDSFAFRRQVMKENRLFVSRTQSYRAKRTALRLVQGSETDQFEKLHDYIRELRRSNPGITVVMKMDDSGVNPKTQQRRFQRLYVCFSGVKQGFLAACRPIFGLDGTFLKGPTGGVLLIATGTDANNGFYPIAHAVAEGENKNSWEWFLTLLRGDLGIQSDFEWTIISDKQKGLIQACELIFPNADHRFCVRHLHGNFASAGFKGQALRKTLWGAAKATTPNQFHEKMNHMAAIDPESVQWFEDKPPAQWSRAYFRTLPKCDVLLNNNCESFNSAIVEYRCLPIVGMLEGIRTYMMKRTLECRERGMRWAGKNKALCPRIFARLNDYMRTATECVPHKANDFHVEVWCPYGNQYVVNLKDHTCSCRKWDLTGIPCPHAISAIWTTTTDPMDYVDSCYSVEAYLKCYEPFIFPVNGESEWEKGGELAPLPPQYNRAPGRPKKARRKNEIEVILTKEKKMKLSRAGQMMKCRHCFQFGHNTRTCLVRKAEQATQEIENTVDKSVQGHNTMHDARIQCEDVGVDVGGHGENNLWVEPLSDLENRVDLGSNNDDHIQLFKAQHNTITDSVSIARKHKLPVRRAKKAPPTGFVLRRSPRKQTVKTERKLCSQPESSKMEIAQTVKRKSSSQPLSSTVGIKQNTKALEYVQKSPISQPHQPIPTRKTPGKHTASDSLQILNKKSSSQPLPASVGIKQKAKALEDIQKSSISQPYQSIPTRKSPRKHTTSDSPQTLKTPKMTKACEEKEAVKRETRKRKQGQSVSQPKAIGVAEPSFERKGKGAKKKKSGFQLLDEDLPHEPVSQALATSTSTPTTSVEEAQRKSMWAVFGLQPPPYPVGCPPPLINEKKSTTIMDQVMDQCFPKPSDTVNDPNVTKEWKHGRLEGFKNVYARFGLQVPKWIDDGLEQILSATDNASQQASKMSSANALKGKGKINEM